MENILLIFVCIIIGIALQRVQDFPAQAYKVLNQYVIYVALPAMALYYIPKIEISANLLYPLGIAWITFALSFAFFNVLGRIYGWSRKLIGALTIVCGLGNTSFVGFPVIEALYGKKGLETAIIVDQPGSFLVMATLGIIVAVFYSRGTPNPKAIVKKILLFPPFVAFMVAITFTVLALDFIDPLQSVFNRLGATVSPVALISVGLQLKIEKKSKHWGFLTLGLLFKLILLPAFFFVLYKLILGQEGPVIEIAILEAAMAPMITGAILASNYGLKPKLSSMLIGIGIPLSFLTLALWYWIITTF